MSVPSVYSGTRAFTNVREATKADALFIARHLRYADLEEILVGKEITASQILKEAWECSKHSFVYEFNGKPASIWGIVPTDHGACVWMLGTDDLDFLGTEILRISKCFISESVERYGIIHNWVDERNTKSLKFLKWLGFTFGDPVMNAGYPFRPFWMIHHKESDYVQS